ncbi:MAG: hypothetical protein PHD51_01825 [Patescibacteria group bacterium]|nr:hypothetical protein [Patescibacteria group bacterium]MDD5490398.1 hypothetical protein [Patescibacteria group bacterium]
MFTFLIVVYLTIGLAVGWGWFRKNKQGFENNPLEAKIFIPVLVGLIWPLPMVIWIFEYGDNLLAKKNITPP